MDRLHLLGEYAGKWQTREEYRAENTGLYEYVNRQCYAYDVSTPAEDAEAQSAEGTNGSEGTKYKFTIDAFGKYGNECAAINDPHGTRMQANSMFVEVLHRGWPHVFVTMNHIKEGDEVLIKYGHAYFKFHGMSGPASMRCCGSCLRLTCCNAMLADRCCLPAVIHSDMGDVHAFTNKGRAQLASLRAKLLASLRAKLET